MCIFINAIVSRKIKSALKISRYSISLVSHSYICACNACMYCGFFFPYLKCWKKNKRSFASVLFCIVHSHICFILIESIQLFLYLFLFNRGSNQVKINTSQCKYLKRIYFSVSHINLSQTLKYCKLIRKNRRRKIAK